MSARTIKATPAPAHDRQTRPGLTDYALLVVLAAIWGASFMLIKISVESIATWTQTAIRLFIAAVFMCCWAALKHERFPKDRSFWLLALVMAAVGNVLPFVLIAWGEERIDSGVAAICLAAMPLMTVVLAHFALTDDRMTLPKFFGVSCGMAGLLILIGPSRLWTMGVDTVRLLAVVAAALCYACNAIYTRKLLRSQPRFALAAAVMLLAVILILPLALWIDKPWQLLGLPTSRLPTVRSLVAVATLSVVQTSIAQILLFKIIARQGPSFFSQVNYFVPLFGVFWGWLVLSETLPTQSLLALGVILCGLAIVRLMGDTPSRPAPKV
jgi:drug/metabolite transporter (DMT)-like permease